MVITGLNVCADTSIKSLFGRLVPLGSVGSPVVAILHDDVGNVYVYISVYIGIGGGNWLSQQGPTCRVERDNAGISKKETALFIEDYQVKALGPRIYGQVRQTIKEDQG